ncbi:MAG: substrate-binding domain-containing protein [Rhizobiales bacterium]|nr:substrate-binding domain-containing protein [Hyphomicrobiales bacterium]
MAYAERNLPLSAALAACLGLFGLQAAAIAEEISIPGVEEGSDILRALAIAFGGHGEGKLVLVPPAIGAGGAVSDVISERAALARINRDLNDDEKQAGVVEFPLFDLPVVLIAHPAVARRNLTSAEWSRIRSGHLRNWRDLGGPDLPIKLVMHHEFEGILPALPAGQRRASAAHTRDVDVLVRQVPGAIGLTTGATFNSREDLLVTLDNLKFDQPAYPFRARVSLAYKSARLHGLAGEFVAFLRSERAARLMLGHGARPVLQ